MPRFAANLGGSPLQPVKSGNVAGNSQPALEADNVSDEVPVAQFDWIGSGLVNPLDGNCIKFKMSKIMLFGFCDTYSLIAQNSISILFCTTTRIERIQFGQRHLVKDQICFREEFSNEIELIWFVN